MFSVWSDFVHCISITCSGAQVLAQRSSGTVNDRTLEFTHRSRSSAVSLTYPARSPESTGPIFTSLPATQPVLVSIPSCFRPPICHHWLPLVRGRRQASDLIITRNIQQFGNETFVVLEAIFFNGIYGRSKLFG